MRRCVTWQSYNDWEGCHRRNPLAPKLKVVLGAQRRLKRNATRRRGADRRDPLTRRDRPRAAPLSLTFMFHFTRVSSSVESGAIECQGGAAFKYILFAFYKIKGPGLTPAVATCSLYVVVAASTVPRWRGIYDERGNLPVRAEFQCVAHVVLLLWRRKKQLPILTLLFVAVLMQLDSQLLLQHITARNYLTGSFLIAHQSYYPYIIKLIHLVS